MMKEVKRRLTLNRPAIYQIKVPGYLDENWTEWEAKMTVTVEYDDDDKSVTTLTGTVDQVVLHGIMHRLYSKGLPLVSVNLVERD